MSIYNTKKYKECYFPDKQIITTKNGLTYNIDNIKCITKPNKPVKYMINEFEDDEERELIKQFMLIPFKFPIPNNIEVIKDYIPLLGGSKKIKHKHICSMLDKIDALNVTMIKH
jgi:hypothetical protein